MDSLNQGIMRLKAGLERSWFMNSNRAVSHFIMMRDGNYDANYKKKSSSIYSFCHIRDMVNKCLQVVGGGHRIHDTDA